MAERLSLFDVIAQVTSDDMALSEKEFEYHKDQIVRYMSEFLASYRSMLG